VKSLETPTYTKKWLSTSSQVAKRRRKKPNKETNTAKYKQTNKKRCRKPPLLSWDEKKIKTKIPRKTILVKKKPALTKSQFQIFLYLLTHHHISLHRRQMSHRHLLHHRKTLIFYSQIPCVPSAPLPHIHTIQYSKEFSPPYTIPYFCAIWKLPTMATKVKNKIPGNVEEWIFCQIEQSAHRKTLQRKKSSVDRYERKKEKKLLNYSTISWCFCKG